MYVTVVEYRSVAEQAGDYRTDGLPVAIWPAIVIPYEHGDHR